MVEYLQKNTYRLSRRKIAAAIGFSTPNLLQLVIKGKRKLNDEGIGRIAVFLNLNDNEKAFFTNLVKMGQSKTHEEKDKYYRLLAVSPRYSVLNKNDKEIYKYYSHWYYPVIRELVTIKDFCPDPSWVAKRISPSISTAEAESALRNLVKMGQLRKTDSGYEQASFLSTTGEVVSSVSVTNFHKAMIAKASESMDRFPHTKRNISSLTFTASQQTYNSIVREIFTLQQRIINMLKNEQAPSEVYQLNFQIFPCTSKSEKDEQ